MSIGYLTLKFMGSSALMLVFVGAVTHLIICLQNVWSHSQDNSYLHIAVSGLVMLLSCVMMYRLESVECAKRYLQGVVSDVNREWDLSEYEPIAYKLRVLQKIRSIERNSQPHQNHSKPGLAEQNPEDFSRAWRKRQELRSRYLSRKTYSSLDTDRMSIDFGSQNLLSDQPTTQHRLTDSNKEAERVKRLYLSSLRQKILTDAEMLDEQALELARIQTQRMRVCVGILLQATIRNSLGNLQHLREQIEKHYDVHVWDNKEQLRCSDDILKGASGPPLAHTINKFITNYRSTQCRQWPLKSINSRLSAQHSLNSLVQQRIHYDQLLSYSLGFDEDSDRTRTHSILISLADGLTKELSLEQISKSCGRAPHFEGPFELQQYVLWFMVTKINKTTCRQGLLYRDWMGAAGQSGDGHFLIHRNPDCRHLHYDLVYINEQGRQETTHTKGGSENIYSLFWMYFEIINKMHRPGSKTELGRGTVFDRVMQSEDGSQRS